MIDTGPVTKDPSGSVLIDTGPVIGVNPLLAESERANNVLKSSRWRTLGSDARPTGWAIGDHERCASLCGGERRCMLREGHIGLHAWRSLGGLRVFEWG